MQTRGKSCKIIIKKESFQDFFITLSVKKSFSKAKICKWEDSIMLGYIWENSLLNYGEIVLFSSFGPAIPPTIQGVASN